MGTKTLTERNEAYRPKSRLVFWSNPNVVTWTPILCSVILEAANVAQMYQMVIKHSSASQSLMGWLLVDVAMVFWWNYYRVCTPLERGARISIKIAMIVNIIGTLVVVVYRYI